MRIFISLDNSRYAAEVASLKRGSLSVLEIDRSKTNLHQSKQILLVPKASEAFISL
jgi:hypothetical protein